MGANIIHIKIFVIFFHKDHNLTKYEQKKLEKGARLFSGLMFSGYKF